MNGQVFSMRTQTPGITHTCATYARKNTIAPGISVRINATAAVASASRPFRQQCQGDELMQIELTEDQRQKVLYLLAKEAGKISEVLEEEQRPRYIELLKDSLDLCITIINKWRKVRMVCRSCKTVP